MAAIERAEEAIAEAETLLSRLASEAEADPRLLEHTEERLFALRAASRKHGVPVSALTALLADLRDRLAALDHGEAEIDAMVRALAAARARYVAAAEQVSKARRAASGRLETAVAARVAPAAAGKGPVLRAGGDAARGGLGRAWRRFGAFPDLDQPGADAGCARPRGLGR